MKVLITYASVGAGHFKAAEAVYNYIRECCPAIEIKLVDVLEKANALFRFNYTFGYSFLVRQVPLLWWWAFWLTDFKALRIFSRPIGLICNRLNTKEFVNFLIQENPDFIISTHFLPSQISAAVKNSQKIKSRLITIITDFTIHPFWVSSGVDLYVVASEFTKKKLALEGVRENSIKVLGIPIDSKFLKQYAKDNLCNKFDIDKNKFTVLIMTGSFGIGPLEAIADALCRDVQILVVCANNKGLCARLKRRNFPNVKVFGFIDNAQELMAVSDIIITKPGGLSISEILSMELAPLFISAIPGQEAGNVKVLKQYGVGISVKRIQDIKNTVLDFRDHPDKLKSIKDNMKKIKKPNATEEICNVICQGCDGFTG